MCYEEDIDFGVQQMLDADLQFPQDVEHKKIVPMSNADRIRAMSDEELAVKIGAFCETSQCKSNNGVVCPVFDNCPRGHIGASWLAWLKQPAEEVNDDTT